MIKQRRTPMVSGLLLAALVAGCAVNPVTGRNELSLFDETQRSILGPISMARRNNPKGALTPLTPNSRNM